MNVQHKTHAYQLTQREIDAMKKAGIKLPLAIRVREMANGLIVAEKSTNVFATTR